MPGNVSRGELSTRLMWALLGAVVGHPKSPGVLCGCPPLFAVASAKGHGRLLLKIGFGFG